MKLGPFTFQCACLHWVCRSIASDNRRLSSAATCERVDSGRSLRVGYSLRPDFGGDLVRVAMVDLLKVAGWERDYTPDSARPEAPRHAPHPRLQSLSRDRGDFPAPPVGPVAPG